MLLLYYYILCKKGTERNAKRKINRMSARMWSVLVVHSTRTHKRNYFIAHETNFIKSRNTLIYVPTSEVPYILWYSKAYKCI